MSFSEKLKFIRTSKNFSRKEIADAIGVTVSAISNYENGVSTPNYETLISLTDYLNVSTDYLLGTSEISTLDNSIRSICDYTGLSEHSISVLHELLTNKECKYDNLNIINLLLENISNKNNSVIESLINYLIQSKLNHSETMENDIKISLENLSANPSTDDYFKNISVTDLINVLDNIQLNKLIKNIKLMKENYISTNKLIELKIEEGK